MTSVLAAMAVVFKLLGAGFLVAAAVGLVRFSDPLQRMHASTKAGTVGAGFILLGVVLQMWDTETTVIGLSTLIFLLLTIPIAGHLLGRAAYVSGARLHGLQGSDALAGVLDRSPSALEERLTNGDTAC